MINTNESEPSVFLVENMALLPKGGRALDVAMGAGRNAIYLAGASYNVNGVDISQEAITASLALAQKAGVIINTEVADLESGYRLPQNIYDVVICFDYLHRPLISQIKGALKSGGFIVYETFIVDQAEFGRPKNPDHLLKHNELLDIFADFRCLRYSEGIYPGPKALASIVAQKS
ncbi:class I SAM-dependent methyltransferase [Chloroflexota bacterium]